MWRRKKAKKPPTVQLELALPYAAPAPPRPPGLWEAVDALPQRALQAHRQRRKLVAPKLRQAVLLESPEE